MTGTGGLVLAKKAECVKVIVRCRPINEKELAGGHRRIVEMDVPRGAIEIKNPKGSRGGDSESGKKTFTFDSVYDWNSTQIEIYDETFRPIVDAVLSGFNGTIFAYGQTGTGKTFTMEGVRANPELRGVIPNSFDHVFTHISRSQNQQYLVRASYLEIYQEEVRDLLAKDQSRRLELKERPDTGVYVKDLSSFVTKSVKEIEHVMNVGNQNRVVGATNMNEHSSRSHAIFIITVECSEVSELDGENHIRVGKLNLVDLAGSERQAKSGATGERLKEATKINLSLSALSNVISALVDGHSTHVPYRDSKLTRLLQDSLGGNAKTVMVANIGPASYNYDESLTTLRYANRAKNIKNKPIINEDPKDALLRQFQEEIAKLREQLKERGEGGSPGSGGVKTKRNKRRQRKAGVDNVSDDDEGDEEEETSGDEEEEFMKKQATQLETEKKAILDDQNMIAEEKKTLLSDLEEKATLLKKQQKARESMMNKIKAMESKLLVGGKTIIDHTNEQQKALETRRREIADQKRKEREMQQKLQEKEETTLDINKTYNSLQHEVDIKTKKLKKLFAKLQAIKVEMEDLHEEYSKERQELEQTLNQLTRELKLKLLIIENFIPPAEKNKVMDRSYFDEDIDEWRLKPLSRAVGPQVMAKRPQSATGNRRPITEFAKRAATTENNSRYKGENIISVELDHPARTTRDYEGPTVAPRVQAALDAALQDEEDIDINIDINELEAKKEKAAKKAKRPKTAKTVQATATKSKSQLYPQSRGLVPKH